MIFDVCVEAPAGRDNGEGTAAAIFAPYIAHTHREPSLFQCIASLRHKVLMDLCPTFPSAEENQTAASRFADRGEQIDDRLRTILR